MQLKNFLRKNGNMAKSLTMIIDKLIDCATVEACAFGDGRHFDRMRQDGYERVPERYKPGRMIMRLPKEDRECLQQATEKDFNHRLI